MDNNDLVSALVNRAEGFQDRAPVFHIEQPSVEDSIARARSAARFVWNQFGDCSLRPDPVSTDLSRMQLPNEGRVDVFHSSGAIAAYMHPPTSRQPLTPNERLADRKALSALTERVAESIAKTHVTSDEQLRFESLWELKGHGVTLKGEKSPVALFEVLGAFRRYLHGLPVLGRASIHVALGGASLVTRWGIDWRQVRTKPFAETAIISPEEGAKRVLDDLFWRRPERPFTLADFEVDAFNLGYLSFSRRRVQFVMQPTWLAVLKPRPPMTMGTVVAVAAAPQAFEPLSHTKMPVA
ncbi:MAG: hypothetical protein JWR32_6378 [Mycobacterium sp.]|jgi:hypothetical protein|nr:hypothetical protein [Mycobacterium sp.]